MKIVSGGQTGVDRAALDAAMRLGLERGGFVPKGRLAEDGRIPDNYPVEECAGEDYPARTRRNALESDATLIFNIGELAGGTLYTAEVCRLHGKPFFLAQLEKSRPRDAAKQALEFLRTHRPRVLNVAGPRESKSPGIYRASLKILLYVFASLPRLAGE
ncbi:MAG: putative molybdenum carrier protein [Elusimicrobia bacterium]|nr:putative molybdenum carrier protein [Elusimicrobiota bacterium]